MVAEMLHLAGLGVIASLKGAILIFLALASLTMYLYARIFWGDGPALVAAAAYTYAPYHLLDLYVRKAFSEFTVFCFLPAVLLALYRLRTRGTRGDVLAGALSLAGLALSHTITNMLAPPLLGAYALLITLRLPGPAGEGKWVWVGRAALATGVGYAIAGFFLVPAFLERNAINLKIYTEAYVDYHKHFVYPQQLVWWPWGFGMSLDGLRDRMSFRMGLLQIGGTALAAHALWRERRRGQPAPLHSAFYLAVTAIAVIMMIPASAWLWDLLPPLRFVQFPWRLLTLTTLSTGLLCGAAWAALSPSPATARPGATPRGGLTVALAVCALFAAGAALGGTLGVNLRVPAARVGFEEKPYNNMIDRGPGAAPETMDGEFVRRHTLRWIDHLPPEVSFMGLGPADLERPRVEVAGGDAILSDLARRTWMVRFVVTAQTAARVRVNVYRFPGWTVRVDGRPVPLADPPRDRRVILFDVPAGRHEVAVVFEKTRARRLGDGMTLAGLAGLSVLGLWPHRRPRAA